MGETKKVVAGQIGDAEGTGTEGAFDALAVQQAALGQGILAVVVGVAHGFGGFRSTGNGRVGFDRAVWVFRQPKCASEISVRPNL